jgi:hypothetical protein
MRLAKRGILCALLFVVAGFFLAGCDEAKDARYAVTLYSGSDVINTWRASTYSNTGNRVTVYLPGAPSLKVSGCFVIEPLELGPNRAGSVHRHVSLYGNATVLRKWDVQDTTNSDGVLSLKLPGRSSYDIIISGTWVSEKANFVPASAAAPRYKVSLYDAAHNMLQSWLVQSYTENSRYVSLTLPGGNSDDVVFAGTYVIEDYAPPVAPAQPVK